MQGPLEGIKVLDFTRVIAGSTCTMYLVDLGAEVIKVEPPQGEVMRYITPIKDGVSGFFVTLNRGKKGITLNLKDERAREIAYELVKKVDIVVENFKPGTMKTLGLDYDTLKEINPSLIYASLSGYGQVGPKSQLPSYDLCIQAMCGLMSMNGYEGKEPLRIGMSITDYLSGMAAALAILGALHYRQNNGNKGQYIDVSMYDCGVSVLENSITRYDMLNEIAVAVGSRHPAASPHNVYKTSDGYIAIITIEDNSWRRLCNVMEKPELADDPRLGKAVQRLKHMDELDEIVESWTKTKKTEEIVDLFTKANLAYGVVQNVKDVIEDEHTKARGMIVEVDQPGLGKVKIPGIPIKYSELSAEVRGPAPTLGQYNKEILCELLGMGEEELEALSKEKVI